MSILRDVPKKNVIRLMQSVRSQTGTPQAPVNWSDPDTWITERLEGEDAQLARRIWEESNHIVNPRYLDGSQFFINIHALMKPDEQGVYRLSERGQAFLDNDPNTIRQLDEVEGLIQILKILAAKTKAKRGDLLPEWSDFLGKYSKSGAPSVAKDTLYRRLVNLIERGFVSREGSFYTITPAGLEYIAGEGGGPKPADDIPKPPSVFQAINSYNLAQRELLRQQLTTMNPYRFEHLIRNLLEAMGYEDVEVTQASGDKGVDVVAKVEFGITTITEVVQVKRHQSNIGRPVLDQLRGSLPYHDAIRGTLITVGGFSHGCKEAALFRGAAPIGLIDGEKLLDLLIEHEIGIRKRPAQLFEVDETFFTDREDDAELME
jgi:restriction system protein